MKATARDIMTPLGEHLHADDSILHAARRMIELNAPAIPVVTDGKRLKGTLSYRDIVELLARGGDAAATKAGEVCGRRLGSVGLDDPVTDVIRVLTEKGQRGDQLAVTDRDGALAGLIDHQDLDAYLRAMEELGEEPDLVAEVSLHDRDSHRSRGVTLIAGLSALRCIRAAMVEAGKESVTSILDFPCGQGRILRVLKAAFPEAYLAVGDLDREAVDFCSSAFGAAPIYSDEDPAKVEIDGSFDLVWCGSLLTHLDADRWRGFLELFQASLAPGGLLVFTTHGRRDRATLRHFGLREHQIDAILADLDEAGFGYVDYVSQKGWGIAIATPEWVRDEVGRLPGVELVRYVERGWNAPAPRQDVFTCLRLAD